MPPAFILGKLTTKLSDYIGDKKGGLLSSTLGNIPELFMGVFAVKVGLNELVKATIIGSIVSNMLLVLGISVFIGGINHKEQKFNKLIARTNFNQILLVMSAIILIASLNKYGVVNESKIKFISLIIAIVFISIYILGLIFSLYTHSNMFVLSEEITTTCENKKIPYNKIILKLILICILLYFSSKKLIGEINIVVINNGFKEEFVGIVLIPLLGNIGENFSAIIGAYKNKINLSLETAIGSSIQMALFVTPLLILISYVFYGGFSLLFSTFQIIVSCISILISYMVFQDGKTYWLEGSILIAVYIMVLLVFYYI